MKRYDYDLFVIGGGSGGVRAARVAAQHGARVAIAEEHRYGGTCVIRGCVPKKIFVYASEFGHHLADAGAYGWSTGQASFDWATLVSNKDREIDRLNGIYVRLLDQAAVTVFHGRAVLADAHTLEVDGRQVTARVVLVATGSRPRLPEIPGADRVISSNEAFHLRSFPRHITIAGGGYIALEFAHIFRGLGAEVTLVHRSGGLLRGFDEDVRAEVAQGARAAGIDVRLETLITAVDGAPHERLGAVLAGGARLETDAVMAAIGRIPNTAAMGLEAAGVALRPSGAVEVDGRSRTSVEHIYAVGDCTDRINLTPVAIREGQAFSDTVFGNRPVDVDYTCVPTAVFSTPPVGTVGLTEAQARERFAQVDIYMARFRPLKYALPGRDERVMMKLVVDGDSRRVLGVHIVGADAPEIIQCMAIPVRMGATKHDLDATMALHPTTAEELVLMRTKLR
ncbi:MAG TPA: glutathione-disulfide reductase [Haliangium sp.]|nr:glutathione-disulfide reductase [Haliangium sp.]